MEKLLLEGICLVLNLQREFIIFPHAVRCEDHKRRASWLWS